MSLENSNHRVAIRVDDYSEIRSIGGSDVELTDSKHILSETKSDPEFNQALIVWVVDYPIAELNLENPNTTEDIFV